MADKECMAEMKNNVHICSLFSLSKDDASNSDPQHFENSSESVCGENCICNVNNTYSAKMIGNSNSDNKDIGEDIINNKQRVKNENICLNISARHDFSEAEFYDADSIGSSSDASVCLDRTSKKSDSPERSNDKSESSERSSNKSDDSHERSNGKSTGSPERLSDKFVDSPERSRDESDSPERLSDKSVDSPERSRDESDSLDRSSDKSDSPGGSSDKSDDSSERSSDKSDSPGKSNDKSDDSSERSRDKSVDSPERSRDKSVDSPGRSSDESDIPRGSSDKSDSSDWSSDISDVSDISSDKSDSPEKSRDSSDNSYVPNENSDVLDKTGKSSDSAALSSDSSETTIVNSGIPETSSDNSGSPDMSIKENEISVSTRGSPDSHNTLSNNLTDRLTINSEKARTVELCVRRMLEKSKVISSRKVFISTTGESSKIGSTNLIQAKEPLNTQNINFKVTEPIVNMLGVTAADEESKIFNYHQSNICILKCPKKMTLNNPEFIYLSREEKPSGDILNKINDEEDSNCVERVECIKSNTEYQTNIISENGQSGDQVSPLEKEYLPIGIASEENIITAGETDEIYEDAIDIQENIISCKDTFSPINIDFGVEKNRPFILDETFPVEVTKNSQYDIADQENSAYESQQIFTDDHLSKQMQVCTFSETVSDNKLAGSQVEDIRQYQTITESGNDWITENLDSDNQLNISFNSLNVLKNVKEMCDSVLDTFHSCINSIIHKAKLKILPDSTNPNADTKGIDIVSVTETIDDQESENDSDDIPSNECFEPKADITNFYILFKHLTAEAGTDVTAEQVKEDINPQVVLDIYNGFHELRTADYANLDLMEKCIRSCLSSLQSTMLNSYGIVKRSSVLLRVETRSIAELQELNQDLKDLADDAEAYMNEIDRALSGLKDFTEDYMYYKDCLNKELVEFLMEDFPEIFK